jgi:hypothetical protein
MEHFTIAKKSFFHVKNSKYLSVGLYEGRPSHRRSLYLSIGHSALQNYTFLIFFLWVHLNPDPIRIPNADLRGSESPNIEQYKNNHINKGKVTWPYDAAGQSIHPASACGNKSNTVEQK